MIGGNAGIAANATGVRQLRIRVDGTTYITSVTDVASSAVSFRENISVIYALADAQYVELIIHQNSTGTLATVNADGLPNFWMYRIG
jgi:hypothetical protein